MKNMDGRAQGTTLRLPRGYPEATPRLPRGYPEATLGCERGEWVALAGNKGRFAQPTIRFPIFGINDSMWVVVWGLGLRRDSCETKEGLPPYRRRWSGAGDLGKA